MNVIRNTPAEFVAEHRPRLVPLLLIALIGAVALKELLFEPVTAGELLATVLGLAVGGLLVAYTARGSVLRLDAAPGTASVTPTGPFSGAGDSVALEAIRDFVLETGRDGARSKIVLLADDRRLASPWHSLVTSRSAEVADAARTWMRDRGSALRPRDGELAPGDRIAISPPDGSWPDWLDGPASIQGRVARFFPPLRARALDRAVVRLPEPTSMGGVRANWLLLSLRYHQPRWFQDGEVYVVAYPDEPRRWLSSFQRGARAMNGTVEYRVARDRRQGGDDTLPRPAPAPGSVLRPRPSCARARVCLFSVGTAPRSRRRSARHGAESRRRSARHGT